MDQFSIVSVFLHTPVWVFIIFVFLIALGAQQSRDRTISRLRLLILPLVMLVFSFYGIVTSFGLSAFALACWLAGFTISAIGFGQRFRYAAQQLPSGFFRVTGSWWPLGLMMAIFFIKYFLGYAGAMNLSTLHQSEYVVLASFILGALSGVFVARVTAGFRG